MKHRFSTAMLVVGLSLESACSFFSPGLPAPRSSWVAQGLPVHTRLSATKDSIVYGGVGGKHLYVVALDPTTGKERWQRRSDVSARMRGQELSIVTNGDTAYFLSEPQGARAVLIAVTSRAGAPLVLERFVRGEAATWRRRPV